MRAGVLLFAGVEELDFTGPFEVLAMRGKVGLDVPPPLLVAATLAPVACANGMTVLPQAGFDEAPALDLLLVPGGPGTRSGVDDRALVGFIARQARGARLMLGVCTGAFLLHRAGLLAGRRATTHWASLERLRALGDVQVVEQRFVADGAVWTSAGVSAGIDMTLAAIAEVHGDEVAGRVQLAAEYYPEGRRFGSAELLARAPRYVREPRS